MAGMLLWEVMARDSGLIGAPAAAKGERRSAKVQGVCGHAEAVSHGRTRRRSPLGRLAILLAAVLAMAAAGGTALAASPYHHGGGRGGPPRMSAPRGSGPFMGGPRAPWGGRGPTGPPSRYDEPPPRYYEPPRASVWARPPSGARGPAGPMYATPPVYTRPAPAFPSRGWRRGGYLPPAYQGAVIQDYGRYHLRRPPYGYNWVQVGGEMLLISGSSGLIFDVVPAY
jgi:Ni/Co efflux regulator RcnB